MAAIGWVKVRGQIFSDEEAREASDFQEIISNFHIDAEQAFELFNREKLTVAKRLVLAETSTLDGISAMLFTDEDSRIREVIQARLREERLNGVGGIIY